MNDRASWIPNPQMPVSVPDLPVAAAHALGIGKKPRPIVRVAAGMLAEIANACEDALIASETPIFQRGGMLVRPMTWEVSASDERVTMAAGLKVITSTMLVDLLSQNAEFVRYDARSKRDVSIDPPEKAASILLSRAGQWKFPTVLGIITAPTIRRDGSILSAPGFDPVTRFYHEPDKGLVLPPMKASPTKEDAARALRHLTDLIAEFPLCTEVDKSVALSAIISSAARGALGMVPLHAFTAPSPGTGKSYIADVTSAILAGRFCPVATAGKTEEETEKRLGALLIAGYSIVSIDNVSAPLGGDLLCQLIERPVIRLRPLGKSEIIELESRATVFANGNNLIVEGDMTRRTILATLDAKVDRPEDRVFKQDPVAMVLADRGSYIAAALTIVRAYILAERPGKLSPLLSFSGWSDNVRSALVWLNKADPAESIKEVRRSDPVLNNLRIAIDAWRNAYQSEAKKTQEVVRDLSSIDPRNTAMLALRDALLPIAGVRGLLDGQRLSYWLRKNKGRPVDGKAFVTAGTIMNVTLWKADSIMS